MMLQSVAHCELIALIICSLFFLHFASGQPVLAGGQCSPDSVCGDGLVCVPETPGSVVTVCKDSNHISCESERCPRVWCGPNLQYVPEGGCCPICPPRPTIYSPAPTSTECTENNATYAEGESWQRGPCVTCTCEAGLPLCTSIQCIIPDCELLIHTPDQCCPTCAIIVPPVTNVNCEYNGETYQNGDSWNPNDDACVTCYCENGETLCASQHCFVDCENPVYLSDTCCPICPDDFSDASVPVATTLPLPVIISPPTHCEDRGQIYQDGERWRPNGDPCTSCLCDRGFNLCLARSCYAACETTEQVFLPDVCCPLCPGDEGYPDGTPTTTESITSSSFTPSTTPPPTTATSEEPTTTAACNDNSGIVHPHGASWCPTPFEKATCNSGAITYTQHHCTIPACQAPLWTPGSCDCPVCPDEEVILISMILAIDYQQYIIQENSIRAQLDAALSTLGLTIADTDIDATEYGEKQTQVVILVSSLSNDNVLLSGDKELEELLSQLKSPLIVSIKVGHHEQPKSVIEANPNNIQSSSTNSQSPDKTVAIVAVVVTLAIALLCAVIIAFLIIHTRKIRSIVTMPKTVNV